MEHSTEEWRAIVGYEGTHEVSSHGRVRSLPRTVRRSDGRTAKIPGRILSLGTTETGYRRITIGRNGLRTFAVHRLVLEAFVGPRPDGMEACHGDGDPANNHVSNLRWDTHGANTLDQVRHGTHNQASKEECPWGHLLSGANLRILNGSRQCIACRREQDQARAQGRPFDPVKAGARYVDAMRGVRRTTRLTEAAVREIRERYANGARQVDLAAEFGVNQPHISRIIRQASWTNA